MNIYGKLQDARVKFQNTKIKKSGLNKFAGYDYLELGDFLPSINQIMKEEGLCSFINFTQDSAVLTLVNTEKPDEQIQFTSPMSTATLKGCHDVQNLGAVQTYLRRYLYINAFEIVEHDALDAVTGSDDKQKSKGNDSIPVDLQPGETISEKQQQRLYAIAKGKTKEAKQIMQKYGYTESKQIKKPDYNKIVDEIEKVVAAS
jgi:hypothetical protein